MYDLAVMGQKVVKEVSQNMLADLDITMGLTRAECYKQAEYIVASEIE